MTSMKPAYRNSKTMTSVANISYSCTLIKGLIDLSTLEARMIS